MVSKKYFLFIPLVVIFIIVAYFLTFSYNEPVDFKLKGSATELSITNNQNQIFVSSNNQVGVSSDPSKKMKLMASSNAELQIMKYSYFDPDTNSEHLDPVLNPVDNFEIISSFIQINSNSINYQITPTNIDLSSNPNTLTLRNCINMKILPTGHILYSIRVPNDATVYVNELADIPIGGWTGKIIHLEVSSDGSQAIPITGNLIVQTALNRLELDSSYQKPVDLTTSYIHGEIDTDKPIEVTKGLSLADHLNFNQLSALTIIENSNNDEFSIDSQGHTQSISLNDNNLLRDYAIQSFVNSPWISGWIIGITGTVVGFIMMVIYDKRKQDTKKLRVSLKPLSSDMEKISQSQFINMLWLKPSGENRLTALFGIVRVKCEQGNLMGCKGEVEYCAPIPETDRTGKTTIKNKWSKGGYLNWYSVTARSNLSEIDKIDHFKINKYLSNMTEDIYQGEEKDLQLCYMLYDKPTVYLCSSIFTQSIGMFENSKPLKFQVKVTLKAQNFIDSFLFNIEASTNTFNIESTNQKME